MGPRPETRMAMKGFMKGTSLLLAAGLIVKLLSVAYRVPFQNMVGDRGFYAYQQIYPFIGIFTAWTAYGFSVAVSKLLADSGPAAHRSIRRIALSCLAVFAAAVFSTLFMGSGQLAEWMGDRQLAPLLQVAAFAVLPIPLLAVLKGRLQAEGQMAPVAYAQIMEQGVRVTVILGGTWMVLAAGYSIYTAGAAALSGTVAGGAAAVIFLFVLTKRGIKDEKKGAAVPIWPAVRKLLVLSAGFSLSALILLLYQLADSFTVFRILADTDLSVRQAMERKGIYDRGQPLIQFGLVLASSIALSVVPLVAKAARQTAGRSPDQFVRLAFRMAFLFAAAASAGLALLMPYVNEMLFETNEGSAALAVFGIQIFWASLIFVWTAILQGIGKIGVPSLFLLIGFGLKVSLNLFLIPEFGIMGAAVAGNAGLACSAACLYLYFKKVWPIRFAPLPFYRGAAIAVGMMTAAVTAWSILGDSYLFDGLPGRPAAAVIALSGTALGAGMFLTVVSRLRILSEREWFFIPLGRKAAQYQLWINSKR
ncbi:putative polysaccharide biosynthesis protein [Indiicoccus explosivorum]|uniref:putative polysaccharide biosynthesis protein n=1 Tax=Indiicoccus explosivorum TaxID=1917864 RepID=UPI001F4EE1C1|nr:polysaccharide biosynthesis protein [Indiicoccus explosivorum]